MPKIKKLLWKLYLYCQYPPATSNGFNVLTKINAMMSRMPCFWRCIGMTNIVLRHRNHQRNADEYINVNLEIDVTIRICFVLFLVVLARVVERLVFCLVASQGYFQNTGASVSFCKGKIYRIRQYNRRFWHTD